MSAPTDEAFLARTRSEWLLSALDVGFRSRPIAVVRVNIRMLRCGPSNRTFVHFAAFLLAETLVCHRLSRPTKPAPVQIRKRSQVGAEQILLILKERQVGSGAQVRCDKHFILLDRRRYKRSTRVVLGKLMIAAP